MNMKRAMDLLPSQTHHLTQVCTLAHKKDNFAQRYNTISDTSWITWEPRNPKEYSASLLFSPLICLWNWWLPISLVPSILNEEGSPNEQYLYLFLCSPTKLSGVLYVLQKYANGLCRGHLDKCSIRMREKKCHVWHSRWSTEEEEGSSRRPSPQRKVGVQ